MKKQLVSLIVIITSICLIGIVITQLFWVRNAIDFKEEQFDNRVSIALKSVVNELQNAQSGGTKNNDQTITIGCQEACGMTSSNIADDIKPALLDSFVREEFENLGIHLNYKYGVFNKETGKFVIGKYQGFETEIMRSNHCTSLNCLWQSYMLSIYFPNESSWLHNQLSGWLIISALFLLVVIFGFSFTIFSLLKQKKLSQIKSDFVNNMTHEFKTPISTISLSSEMLMKPSVNVSPEKILKYANVIYDENTRLKNQVEQILRIAVLDKGDSHLKKEKINLHKTIEICYDNINMIVKQCGGIVNKELNAENYFIVGDEIHIANIISNLLDNANKYSSSSPIITIKTFNKDQRIFIAIEDKGIGISKAYQKDVFKQFYRVPTGNIHDVKGFGLGLYYVKIIVENHNGQIALKSELNQGTTFEINFPFLT